MKTSPQNLPNEISRGYPGRFIVDEIELKRLVSDIQELLLSETDSNSLHILYLVGLKNGIAYETEDLDVVLKEENAQSLKIVLLVIHAQVLDKDGKLMRGILVHFHRGKMNRASDWLEMSTGVKFNLNFEGLGYYIRDMNRQSALEVINKLEERLKKFRRYYSNFPEFVNPYFPFASFGFATFVTGILLYLAVIFVGVLPPITISGETIGEKFIFPKFTTTLATTVFAGFILAVIVGLLISLIVNGLNWLIPPSVIAIGDEANIYKKQLRLRESIFWTIIIGGLVGVVVNILTK